MKSWAEDRGLMEIMNLTWFCHNPMNGKPCGQCNPCKYTIEEGLTYRFDEAALRRYKKEKIRKKIRNSIFYRRPKKIYSLVKKKLR